jgi:phthalate 4,5-dioxygenase oxygenase subunit
MVMSKADNEDLCRIGPDAVMGAMLRRFWHPVLLSDQLEAGGRVERLRLLGQDQIIFRTTDGKVGVLDSKCPHRCASMTLARHEGDGVRCIFHAWKFDAEGRVLAVPSETPDNAEAVKASVRARHYPVREAGGLIWVFLDDRAEPPPFPDFPFTTLPPERRYLRTALVNANWVQLFEAFQDSSHVEQLHRETLFPKGVPLPPLRAVRLLARARTEFEETPLGTREAAVRDLPDGRRTANIKSFIAPYYVFLPAEPGGVYTLVISVPIDDEHSRLFLISGEDSDRPIDRAKAFGGIAEDPFDLRGDVGSAADNWRQNLEAVRAGHANGLVGRTVIQEDIIVAESMGPIADRTHEHPTAVDSGIEFIRARLLASARDFRREGRRPWGLPQDGDIPFNRYDQVRTLRCDLPAGSDWRDIDIDGVWAKCRAATRSLPENQAERETQA